MTEILFYIFSATLLLSAFVVVGARNPVYAVLFLIFSFFNASALFILLGAEYIALTLVIVYVGAVAVLFLFVIMMLDISVASIGRGARKHLPVVMLLGAIAFAQIFMALSSSLELMPNQVTDMVARDNTLWIGSYLYTYFVLPFQLAGLLLLVAMIGAIVLTLRHSNKTKRQNIHKQISRTGKESVSLVKKELGEGVEV